MHRDERLAVKLIPNGHQWALYLAVALLISCAAIQGCGKEEPIRSEELVWADRVLGEAGRALEPGALVGIVRETGNGATAASARCRTR
jgi:hypothetical protein